MSGRGGVGQRKVDVRIRQRNHAQTQGKIECFHQTLKRWLTPRPRPTDLNQLQALLDTFRQRYNTARPHRALPERRTQAQAYTAYTALPKASPPI
jgi:transposase InsO family protein